jgi:hypothetical protein
MIINTHIDKDTTETKVELHIPLAFRLHSKKAAGKHTGIYPEPYMVEEDNVAKTKLIPGSSLKEMTEFLNLAYRVIVHIYAIKQFDLYQDKYSTLEAYCADKLQMLPMSAYKISCAPFPADEGASCFLETSLDSLLSGLDKHKKQLKKSVR